MPTQLINIKTGYVIAQTIMSLDFFVRWHWVQDALAEAFECSIDDVGCFETDDCDDVYTVHGEPVARLAEWDNAPRMARLLAA